jgi:hypothetical protein
VQNESFVLKSDPDLKYITIYELYVVSAVVDYAIFLILLDIMIVCTTGCTSQYIFMDDKSALAYLQMIPSSDRLKRRFSLDQVSYLGIDTLLVIEPSGPCRGRKHGYERLV